MADLTNIGCCGCFSFLRKPSVPARQPPDADVMLSQDLLEDQSAEDPDGSFYTGDDPDLSFYNGNNLDTSFLNGDDPDKSFYDRDDNDYLDESDTGPPMKSSEDIIQSRAQNGFACREVPVKEANKVFRSEDENCNKMVNQYVHLGKIGSGSYGKVVLYRNVKDGKLYAVKVLNKPYMLKVHVVRSETAMTDVLRENVIHGDIKPDNLLVTSSGNVKIGDFSVSQVFEDEDDMLWRSPGTPVFTAPECCQVQVQHIMVGHLILGQSV
ncbi:hypothetical protein SORBI_3001G117900 [Sorghum bicolor]|uniref:Protein kinase domain-containing protein n=1 Tax=Sorghum bicolor TaxID=4558 RepID=A0A1Z5S5B9_SORBI|nr:hypothetical protein SORBI_3001G117900 [Sorghum bicolor]